MQLIGKLQLEIIFKTSRWGTAVIFFGERWAGGPFNGLCGVKLQKCHPCFVLGCLFFDFEK